jgi:DNA-binding transcriptional LysR family regulator
VDLTEAGQALLPYAERILALRAEGAERARSAQAGILGRLALGANPSCSQYLTPRLIEEFWSQHPGVRLYVRTALTPELMEDLRDGSIQLALGSRPQMHPHADVLWSYEDELALLAGPSHPLARQRTCACADLMGQTFLSTLAGPTQQALHYLLPDPAAEVALEATAGEVMKRLVCAGAGLTVLPRLAVWDELATGALVPITVRDAHLPPYEIALACWRGRELSAAAEALRRYVQVVRVPALLGRQRV